MRTRLALAIVAVACVLLPACTTPETVDPGMPGMLLGCLSQPCATHDSPGSIADPDLVSSKRIPVVGEEITLSARLRGRRPGEPLNVRFLICAPDIKPTSLQAQPSAQQDSATEHVDYEAKWKPDATGFYTFLAQVDPADKSSEPFRPYVYGCVTLPVTWTDLHILSWSNPKNCRYVGTAAYCPDPKDIPYWRRRGTKPLSYMYIIEHNLVDKSQDELTALILENARKMTEAGYDGYLIDELGSYPTQQSMGYIHRIGIAYAEVRKKYPNLQGYNWTGGGMLREEADMARSAGHILMTESYPDLFSKAFGSHSFEKRLENRIQNARNADALFTPGGKACTIIALGVGADCGVPWRPNVENWVRVGRKLAPEAPGTCYYPGGQSEQWNDPKVNYQEFLDDLTVKYFLKPVLMIKETDLFLDDYDVAPGKTVNVTARVRNIGGMKAKSVRVNIYARSHRTGRRRLVRETMLPEIGNGIHAIKENDPPSYEVREVNGVTYPAMYYKGRAAVGTTWVYVDRALVTVPWTPRKAGYYTIEVEVDPSDEFTILEGTMAIDVPVKD